MPKNEVLSGADTESNHVAMDTTALLVLFCHVCEQPTEHLYLGEKTQVAGGAVAIDWWTCKECGAENLS